MAREIHTAPKKRIEPPPTIGAGVMVDKYDAEQAAKKAKHRGKVEGWLLGLAVGYITGALCATAVWLMWFRHG